MKRFGFLYQRNILDDLASLYQIKGCLEQQPSSSFLLLSLKSWTGIAIRTFLKRKANIDKKYTCRESRSKSSCLFLQKIERSSTTMLDRWSIEITEITETDPMLDQQEEHSGSNKEPSSKDRRVSENIPFNIINNYFSIGVVRFTSIRVILNRLKPGLILIPGCSHLFQVPSGA